MFPGEEDCQQSSDKRGNLVYICVERDKDTRLGNKYVLAGLISYFLIKTTFLVYFLHAFARKLVWEEECKIEAQKAEEFKKQQTIREEKKKIKKDKVYE